MGTPEPLWRWWTFCAFLELDRRLRWPLLREVWAWCILPEWIASKEDSAACRGAWEFPEGLR